MCQKAMEVSDGIGLQWKERFRIIENLTKNWQDHWAEHGNLGHMTVGGGTREGYEIYWQRCRRNRVHEG